MKCDNGRSQFREKEDVGTLSVSCEHCQEVLGVLLFFFKKSDNRSDLCGKSYVASKARVSVQSE